MYLIYEMRRDLRCVSSKHSPNHAVVDALPSLFWEFMQGHGQVYFGCIPIPVASHPGFSRRLLTEYVY